MSSNAYDPVTLDINTTDKERTAFVGVRQYLFYVLLLSDKYASSLVMLVKSLKNWFCPGCPECVRYSTVLDPVDRRCRCRVMFVAQSGQVRQGHYGTIYILLYRLPLIKLPPETDFFFKEDP